MPRRMGWFVMLLLQTSLQKQFFLYMKIKNKDNDMPQGRRIQLKNFHSMSLRQK